MYSTYWMWRLRLRPPHQVWWAPPMYICSCLAPVSFAGVLIKCLHVHWQSAISAPMPLCVAVSAPCGLLLPRVAAPCVSSAALSVYVCRASAVRHGYTSPFGSYPPVGYHPPMQYFPCLAPVFSPLACSLFCPLFMSATLRLRLSLSLLQPSLWAFSLSDLSVSPPCMLPISCCPYISWCL